MLAPRLRGVALPLLLLGSLGAPALAQEGQKDVAVTEGVPQFRPPELIERAEAVYPPEALAAGRTGTVVLEFDVDEKGQVTEAKVKIPAGHGFDEAALEAVKRFRFRPAEHDRAPVPSRVTYSYTFVLKTVPASPEVAKPREDEVRLRGGVFLKGTRAPLRGGSVIALPKAEGRTTTAPGVGEEPRFRAEIDDEGRFELRGLPEGRYKIVVTGPKAKRFETEETIGAREVVTVKYYVEPSQYARYESTVRADPNREEISRKTLTTEELVKMPGSMGDALRAVENLPGVARAPFNTGLIIVRGGKPTDSRVFLGMSEVPQLYHFGGLTSIVPTRLIERVDYFPGNFGVRYGRAIAGAIDVDLREGKRDRWRGSAEVNVFDAGFTAEGPVGKGAVVLAARRSYVDALLGAVLPQGSGLNFTSAPVYYDYQALLDYPVGGGKLRLAFLGSDDVLKLVFDRPQDSDAALSSFGTHIYFHKAMLRYTKSFGAWQLFTQMSGGYQSNSGAVGRDLRYDIGVGQMDWRIEGRWQRSKQLRILLGADVIYANVALDLNVPAPTREGQTPSPISAGERTRQRDVTNLGDIGLYAEALWKPIERLSLSAGLRFDWYSQLHRPSFDPRLSGKVQLFKYTWLKAGLGLYSQHPQPTDYNPKFGNPDVRPEKALHTALTIEQGLLPGLMVEATGFYKHLYDLSTATSQYVLRGEKVEPERVASVGTGRVYGLELLVRQSVSKYLFGWLSYTLMKSERKDCATCGWRLFDFDQTHIFVVALHGYLPKGWELGLRFRYISGLPASVPYGGYYDADGDLYAPARGPVNTTRLEDYHALDFRIDKTFLFKRWVLKLYLDVLNVYNHQNAETVSPSFDFTRQTVIRGLPVLPSFGVRGEF